MCDLTKDVASRVAEEFTKRSRQILGDNLVGAPIDEVFGEVPKKYHELLRIALAEYRGAKPEYDRNAAKEYASEMLQRIRNKEIQANMEPVKGDY